MLAPLLSLAALALAAQTPGLPPVPIARSTPVAELPGMGRPVDTALVAARRRAVARAIGRGLALVPAAHERDLEHEFVQDNDFRQSNTFFYLTELETQDAWLLVAAAAGGDSVETALFLPARNAAAERWTGLRLAPDSVAARLSGIARVLPLDSLDAAVSAAARRIGPAPVYVPLDGTTREEERITRLVFPEGRPRDVRNVRPIVDSLRMVKDADEIARLRRAIDVTVAGHLAAARALRPGMWEYQLESVLEGAFRWNGADRLGFPSIVGSGPNSTTFHYDVNRRQMQDGDIVVVDIGAEWGQYTADVTRTLPVNGRFSSRQRAIYELVLGAQRVAFDSTRPGVTLGDLNRIARAYLKEHSGKLCGEQTCDAFFGHGLSHHLGMDVHDLGVAGRSRLEPGMVITIEPGVYLPDEHLGVRIEDDVLVTATGAEWLSGSAPRDPAEIERLMRRR
jgi:Xaa-Pro aminopeptidase